MGKFQPCFRFIGGLGLACMLSVGVTACSSDDASDTSVNRSSDDDRQDDRGAENGEAFTIRDYYEQLCEYYERCSTSISHYYGAKEQCVTYSLSLISAFGDSTLEQTFATVLNAACLHNLGSLPCLTSSTPDREVYDTAQLLYETVVSCIDQGTLPCADGDSCPSGKCSAQGGECGVCEPLQVGQCRSFYDCKAGQTCLDERCQPTKATGAACGSSEECASGRCTNSVCVESAKEGASCEGPLDCASYLWCSDGACKRPGGPGVACQVGVALSCQAGYACKDGTCQEVGYDNVPVGGLCATAASCVKGARCSAQSVCVETNSDCVIDNQCPEGYFCSSVCLAQRANGELCQLDSECKSGRCSDTGVCAERKTCR